ncbi:MAG: deoxyribodipyrimidine photo-lyase [Candidatus Limnocylindrales bacterium]
MAAAKPIAIVWFRRDLRLHDQPALAHALTVAERVLPLFVVDPAVVHGRWHSPNRLWHLARSLERLDEGLRERGASLVTVVGRPADEVPRVAAAIGASMVAASRDLSPYGRARDDAVRGALRAAGVELRTGRGLLVHEPEDIRREDGGSYRVFSPFHRAWQARELRPVVDTPGAVPMASLTVPWARPIDAALGHPVPTADPELLLEPGEPAARRRLAAWAGSETLQAYASGRDRLDLEGTSRLSQDLRWGTLSPVEVMAACDGAGTGPARFRSEIAWRDFFAHLLWHDPTLARRSFRRELDGVAWQDDPGAAKAWTEGRTGYPVVDAAMRQLRATGWMHNRARMIVASFLTKHLGVDWRVGETHFMEHLVDGDPASNTGGWQWSASVGADAQPYIRILNPTLQGIRHDPQGDYVRRWVPELRGIDGPAVHEPLEGVYIPRVVDHGPARQRALEAYRTPGRDGHEGGG